jgi:hypothetical protein
MGGRDQRGTSSELLRVWLCWLIVVNSLLFVASFVCFLLVVFMPPIHGSVHPIDYATTFGMAAAKILSVVAAASLLKGRLWGLWGIVVASFASCLASIPLTDIFGYWPFVASLMNVAVVVIASAPQGHTPPRPERK